MTTQTAQILRVQRTMNAPVEKVYNALMDEKAIAQWFGCDDLRNISVEVENKKGGKRNFTAESISDGHVIALTSEYLEIIPNERIKFTWNSLSCEPPVSNTVVTIELKPVGDKTELTLLHENLPSEIAAERHELGWTNCLNKLGRLLLSQQGHRLMSGVVPHIAVENAAEAIAFYTKAFGAMEMFRLPMEDGRLMHAHLKINGGDFLLCDHFCETETALSANGLSFHLDVPDADAVFQKAIDAGATVKMPLNEMFWGARYGQLKDPYGMVWSVSTPVKSLSPEEILAGAKACFKH